MNLKQLFSEGDFGTPSPQTPADTLAVIEALKRARWSMRVLSTMTSWDISMVMTASPVALVNYLRQNNVVKVDSTNFMVFTDINRYNNNAEFVEPLRQVYYPNIDVPPTPTAGEFHSDDEFEEDERLLGFEFVISGAGGEIEIEAVASLADTNETIELAPPIRKFIYEKYMETLEQVGKLLSQP
jgi:hypothetical protein